MAARKFFNFTVTVAVCKTLDVQKTELSKELFEPVPNCARTVHNQDHRVLFREALYEQKIENFHGGVTSLKWRMMWTSHGEAAALERKRELKWSP